MKNKNEQIELLNSEGCILKAIRKYEDHYALHTSDECIGILTMEEMQGFIHGETSILDGKGKVWRYSEYPGSMKPDLRELDEFIGIDTTGKIY
jgi:hypothetical protein